MQKIFLAIGLIILSSMMACRTDKLEPNTISENCGTALLTYTNDMEAIINETCAYSGCHSIGANSIGDFTNYETMLSRLENESIFNRVVKLGDMPPNYATGPQILTQEQLDLFTCWLDNGFLE